MKEFLSELIKNDIYIDLVEGELSVKFPKKGTDKIILEEIKYRKKAIVQYLKNLKKNEFIIIPALAKANCYPISNAQKRLWILSQFEKGSVVYNTPENIYLNQDIDIVSFKKAIDSTIERHEILRTIFKEDEMGEVKQWVLKKEDLGFEIEYKDFRKEKNKKEEVQLYINEDSNKSFDLVSGPLLRASLLRVEDNEYVFYYNMHHIISDGWSRGVLSKDVLSFYEAYKENKEPVLKSLRIQYKDYSVWQLKQLEEESFKAHREYWIESLKGELPLIDLPGAKQRPRIKTYNGNALITYLDKTTTTKLTKYSQEKGGSLFMGLLAAWNVLIFHYTLEKDIIIGTATAGREHADLEDQIGFYINALALRNEIKPEEDFNAFYHRLKDNTIKSYSHQMYPFDKLVEELDLKRDASRSPIFDIRLNFNNTGEKIKYVDLNERRINSISDMGKLLVKYDLDFHFIEEGEYISMQVNFNEDIYEKYFIEKVIKHYKNLISQLIDNPNEPIGKINFLLEEEKHELLFTFNESKLEYPKDKTIVELFTDQVAKTPEQVAVVFKSKKLTYKELDKLSTQLANYIQKNYGIIHGDLVGIQLSRSEWLIVSILGVLKAGGVYVPIDPEDPFSRKKHIINDSSPKVLITEVNFIHDIDYYTGNVFAIDVEFDSENYSSEQLSVEITNNNIAYVIYTSGSMGEPKGVMINSQSLVDYSFGILSKTNLYECKSFGLVSTIAADLGNTVVYTSLLIGATLHIIAKEDILDVDILRDSNIDCLKMTPSHWRALQTGQFFVPNKCLILGGEQFPKELLTGIRLNEVTCEVYNHYGPTETTIGKLIKHIDKTQSDIKISLGRPMGNNQVYVLNTVQQLCPIGVTGEICISGDGLARGYLNQEQYTKEKFITNPFKEGERMYRTGDLGRWLPDGNIEFIGRNDDQVKIRGYRIELGEIESAINNHEGVESCAVMVRVNEEDEKSLVACIVPNSETAFTVRQILNTYKDKVGAEAELYEMENGISMYSYNKSEAKILHKEIFTNKTYDQSGIIVPPNACIIDIGANVGTFSVYSMVTFENAQIYSFEPLSPIYDLLKRNTSLYKGNVKVFNVGISDKEEEAMLDYYPYATVLSGRYSEKEKITESVMKFISNSQEGVEERLTDSEIEELLSDRLVSQKYMCKLKTLSQIIKENEISRIELLKIDAENAEMEILEGILEEDWQKIDQIILEVYDDNDRLEKIKKILFSHDFNVSVNQSEEKNGTSFYNVYSIKEKKSFNVKTKYSSVDQNWYGTNELIENIRKKLAERFPDYMIPSDIILLESIPLTSNGKLDRKIIAGLANEKISNKIDFVAPRNEIEEKITKIWEKILQKENISVRDDFFALGGHSLKVLQVNREYQLIHSKKVPLLFFMSNPTISEHAKYMMSELDNITENNDQLIKLNTFSKTNKSIIMIPPLQGESIYFMSLSGYMENKFNCYGINYGAGYDFKSILEIAKYYAEAISRQLPNRTTTLNIMGFSMGAAIAFEMIKILEDMSYNCKLFLVDRIPNTQSFFRETKGNEFNEQDTWFRKMVEISTKISPKDNPDIIKKRLINNLRIQDNYFTSGKIRSNISCLQGLSNDPKLSMESWKKYTTGKFWMEKIESSHHEIFNKENNEKLYNFIQK